MIRPEDLPEIKAKPSRALLAAVDELALATEGLNGFVNLVLDKGDGKSANVTFSRQGVACLLEPLLQQFRDAHAILDAARKQLYPPAPGKIRRAA